MGGDVRGRFEAKVDRCGDHHLWLGTAKADGTGVFELEGRPVLASEVNAAPLPARRQDCDSRERLRRSRAHARPTRDRSGLRGGGGHFDPPAGGHREVGVGDHVAW
jgi:hypothetical protein